MVTLLLLCVTMCCPQADNDALTKEEVMMEFPQLLPM